MKQKMKRVTFTFNDEQMFKINAICKVRKITPKEPIKEFVLKLINNKEQL